MLQTLLHEWRTLGNHAYADEFIVRAETPGYCAVMAAGSLEGVADEIIQREIDHHAAIGRDFEWTLYSSDIPNDMQERLERFGFVPETKEVVCALNLETAVVPTKSSIRVEQVSNAKTLSDFRSVAEAVFGKDFSFTVGVLTGCLEQNSTEQVGFVAYDDETPVSIGRVDKKPDGFCAGLYTGGTLDDYRGRGFYRALVWERVRFAQMLGARIAWVDAKPTSLPILQKLGFEAVVESWPYHKQF